MIDPKALNKLAINTVIKKSKKETLLKKTVLGNQSFTKSEVEKYNIIIDKIDIRNKKDVTFRKYSFNKL